MSVLCRIGFHKWSVRPSSARSVAALSQLYWTRTGYQIARAGLVTVICARCGAIKPYADEVVDLEQLAREERA